VLLEAISQGLPIISTNAPYGPSEVLGNGKYGILTPVGDEEKMAEAMIELLSNKKRYNHFARKSLERVKFFSEEKMLKAYMQLILRLVENSK
jgi:glycosyltransferase involved in cell wall biosynthesis